MGSNLERMKDTEKIWIEVGYRTFAYDGPSNLKIERLAKEVGKNKSSFYHLFVDLKLFTQKLLDFHFEQARCIAQKEVNASNELELINILINHKVDLLFNRQLRFHRENPDFEKCFNKINSLSIPALIPLWKEIIGLPYNSSLAEMVLVLSIENFYLQITDSTLNQDWLKSYFESIRAMVAQFKFNRTLTTLDGSD